ncbi:alpha/beta fold hydrolase [Paenibacillus popilliae]|uniref:Alpha/beta hydrolase n=1 Tax=Paenibacillus popilliae TaxID=78057 RepID=A0ABY3AM31_PAEPP|nr:alpha/beta hydrolase [Paenibacillus sp. SDF0028]TQR40907.1 alpha/beta hydrolase [Paenibacillus sp. SDF0028]
MIILLSVILGGLLIMLGTACLVLLVQYKKKKKANQIRIAPTSNGIDCREFVTIGGISQYLHHRGEDVDNPVMLFLHGGPGEPILPFAQEFQIPWEKHITVVHWDQRNCGKTYFNNDPKQVTPTTTVDRIVQDTYEVVQYLKKKYSKEKIIILGHSWGSVLGSLFTKKYPELVQAYIGVGQIVNMIDNERVGYEKVLESAKEAGNENDVRALLRLKPYPPNTFDGEMIRKLKKVRKFQSKYKLAAGPTIELIGNALSSPFYTFKDMRYFFISGAFGDEQRHIWKYLMEFDLASMGAAFEVPVFFIHGERDWQTPYPLAREFYSTIKAPLKQFYSIPDAGHIVMLERKEIFNEALFDILERVNSMMTTK